jgi:dienelactone hydrolase
MGVLANPPASLNAVGGQPPPLWGKLQPGPHSVGFRSVWQFDYGHSYQMVFDDKTTYTPGKAPRPILVNIWYPAIRPDAAKPMPHGDYLAIQTEDTRVARFAAKLAAYERGAACHYLMGKPAEELSEPARAVFDEFWKTPTACFRDASPVDARFPLVVYHAGAGSSYEDNSILCEFLASHGYVVVGSAFQDASGDSFNVGGPEYSSTDMEFLIAYARRFPYVDWSHVAVIGHSLGAQSALMFQTRDSSPADAIVSLDTTQDYHTLADPRWSYLTDFVLKRAPNFKVPLLVAARNDALFELADQLKESTRHYLTIGQLDHEDFIAQGIIRHELACRLDPASAKLRQQLQEARPPHEALCDYVLDFLDGCFKRNSSEKSQLARKLEQNAVGGPAPHLEIVARGVASPEPFRDTPNQTPAPRQLRPLLAQRGLDETLKLLEQCHARDPGAPIFLGDFAYALVYELLAKGRKRDAVAVRRLYRTFGQDIAKVFLAKGNRYREFASKERAQEMFEKAQALDPDNPEPAQRLKELRESPKEKD